MYKIAEERFQELYRQYACRSENTQDYSHYLQSVQENGQSLFDIPKIYLTNEVIMTALETPNNPIELLPRMILERCISKRLNEHASLYRYYHEPITENTREVYLRDLTDIIEFRYNKSFYPNHNFYKAKLYTFIDFFKAVTKYYSGMDTICYVYLFRGISIPIHIMENQVKLNYKLLYKAENKELHLITISENEYHQLWNALSEKMKSYYKESSFLPEYCWNEPQADTNIIPILQDGEYYETFKTIEECGVVYDYSRSHIISVPNDLVEFTFPDEVESFPENCFMGNKSLKKVKFSSSIDTIPKAAFMDCVSLEEIDLSSVDAYEYSRIRVDSAAFCNCKSLKEINTSILELEDNTQLAFAYCTSLKDISNLRYYGNGRSQMNFFHCDSITELSSSSVSDYGEFDFAYCLNLKKITTTRNTIRKGVFCGCKSLESFKFEYNSDFRHEFGEYCFAGCNSLKEIDTLKGGALISDYTFLDCTSLEKIRIHKKQEWYSKISPSAFEGCNRIILVWDNDTNYPYEETIEDYWRRKGVEVDEKKRLAKLVGNKFKEKLLNVYETIINKTIDEKRPVIGKLYEKDGKHIGTNVLYILTYDLCSWQEYLKIGRVFYESIPFSNMDDDEIIRTAIVYWAKTCTIRAYIKAPIHNKFDALQLVYNILKISHSRFDKGKTIYGERASKYAENDVLNTYFSFEEIEENASDEQKAFIENYTALSDIRMSYLLQIYLLKHLSTYNRIIGNEKWYYANKEIEKLTNHTLSCGNINSVFLHVLCRHTWHQFIQADVENTFEELGQDQLDFERNTAFVISFNGDEICWSSERISDSRPYGVNLMFPDDASGSYDSSYEDNYNGYGRYAGSYAQDEMGYSDDDIDDIFDGDPDAYWNID